jgi:hypothetical protein
VQVSKRFGYRWTLAGDWYFVPAETVRGNRLEPWYELTVAKRHGSEPLLAAVLVTDMLSLGVGEDPQDDDDLDRTEHVESEFREGGVELVTTSRQRMLGVDVVQLDGIRQGLHVSFRIFDRGNLRFELRCVGGAQSPPWPCDTAFAHVDFGTPPPSPVESTTPRPLHIRDEEAGFTFEPPDDTWLSTGPHRGTGGAQVVWMWQKDDCDIAVQTLNLSMYPPSRTVDVQKLAEGFRRKGRRVRVKSARLSTDDWELLQTDDGDGTAQDMFVLTRGRYAYLIMVTAPKRDPALLEKARKGFHFIAK